VKFVVAGHAGLFVEVFAEGGSVLAEFGDAGGMAPDACAAVGFGEGAVFEGGEVAIDGAALHWRIAAARETEPMTSCTGSAFDGFRFPREVIALAVRWYLRYGLSYRDVEELLAERGIRVDHVTVYRWVQRFTAEFIEAARPCRRLPGDRWFVDETYVKVAGRWTYLYRAIDQHGQVIDVMLSIRRDQPAARAF
jgi:hypothetical protein